MKQEIELQEEREQAIKRGGEIYAEHYMEGFIDSVNFKVAERIKINYTIGILHELLEEFPVGSKESKIISDKFQQLQNQLKEQHGK